MGNIDAWSSSAWHLKSELKQHVLWNSLPQVVTAAAHCERRQLHSLHYSDWTRRSHSRSTPSSSSVQIKYNLIFHLSGDAICFALAASTQTKEMDSCFECYIAYKKSPWVVITGRLLMKKELCLGNPSRPLRLWPEFKHILTKKHMQCYFSLYFVSLSDCYQFTDKQKFSSCVFAHLQIIDMEVSIFSRIVNINGVKYIEKKKNLWTCGESITTMERNWLASHILYFRETPVQQST